MRRCLRSCGDESGVPVARRASAIAVRSAIDFAAKAAQAASTRRLLHTGAMRESEMPFEASRRPSRLGGRVFRNVS
jgi:hypothetical protein